MRGNRTPTRDEEHAKQKAKSIEYYYKYRADPEKRARILANQREARALRLSNPDYAEKVKQKKKEYYWAHKDAISAAKKTPEYRAWKRKTNKTDKWAQTLYLSAKSSSIKKELTIDISTEWIEEQFKKQKGKCFYSGLDMVICDTARGLRRPSLDKRDPSKGYTKDNTVLCCWAVNAAKGTRPEAELIAFLGDLKST